jgi:histone-lysine N-methyltransferase SETMAR
MESRRQISQELLTRYEEDGLWKNPTNLFITGDESWIRYDNVIRKKQWVNKGETPHYTAKAGLHPKQVLFCVWWDIKGPVHWELIIKGKCIWWDVQGIRREWDMPKKQGKPMNTINGEVYAAQMDRLKEAISQKRPGTKRHVILQHDNATPHRHKDVLDKIAAFGWEILPHAAYSPDKAPTDYHLNRSIKNKLGGKKFANDGELMDELKAYFASKKAEFFKRGIEKLPDRWQEIINMDGDYFPE